MFVNKEASWSKLSGLFVFLNSGLNDPTYVRGVAQINKGID